MTSVPTEIVNLDTVTLNNETAKGLVPAQVTMVKESVIEINEELTTAGQCIRAVAAHLYEIKQNIKLLTKYKNFILVIINNDLSKKKRNTDFTLRYYGIGAQILKDFNIKNMILLSRTKKKIISLEGFDLKIKKQIIIK